jgi:hypothetical protein
MKRSEMVDKIVEYFKQSDHHTVYDDMAEEILKCVESLGMQPPLVEEESYIMNKQGRMVDVSRRWEDETK